MFADEFVELPTAGCEGDDGGGGEFDEDAIGLGGRDECAAEGGESGGEFLGLVVGVGGVTQPRTVAEDGIPLGGGETHLGGELAGLFNAVVKLAGEIAVEKHDGFGGEQAVFRAAEAQDVDPRAPGEVGRRVTAALVEGGGRVCETSAVEVHGEIVEVRPVGQSVEFGGGVDGSEFRRLGQRECA